MSSIIIFLIVCGLIWEIIDRIKTYLKLQKFKRGEFSYPKVFVLMGKECPMGYIKNERRISETEAIEFNIFWNFCRNIEHKGNYIQSFAEYNGKKVYIIFYDWRQNPLWRLADYFYKMEK